MAWPPLVIPAARMATDATQQKIHALRKRSACIAARMLLHVQPASTPPQLQMHHHSQTRTYPNAMLLQQQHTCRNIHHHCCCSNHQALLLVLLYSSAATDQGSCPELAAPDYRALLVYMLTLCFPATDQACSILVWALSSTTDQMPHKLPCKTPPSHRCTWQLAISPSCCSLVFFFKLCRHDHHRRCCTPVLGCTACQQCCSPSS